MKIEKTFPYVPVNNAQWESVLVVRGQIFEHFSKYFTIWEITFLLITQSYLNGFKFRKKKVILPQFCLSY